MTTWQRVCPENRHLQLRMDASCRGYYRRNNSGQAGVVVGDAGAMAGSEPGLEGG